MEDFDIYAYKGLKFLSHMENDDSYLAHYGVKGQKKGQRRYQNPDGSLTPEGYRHYGIDPNGRQGKKNDIISKKMDVYNKLFNKTDEIIKNYDPKTVKKDKWGYPETISFDHDGMGFDIDPDENESKDSLERKIFRTMKFYEDNIKDQDKEIREQVFNGLKDWNISKKTCNEIPLDTIVPSGDDEYELWFNNYGRVYDDLGDHSITVVMDKKKKIKDILVQG